MCYPTPPTTGACFLVGGVYYRTQEFNALSNRTSSSLLFLATIGIMIPTLAASVIPHTDDPGEGPDEWVLSISRGVAIIMLCW